MDQQLMVELVFVWRDLIVPWLSLEILSLLLGLAQSVAEVQLIFAIFGLLIDMRPLSLFLIFCFRIFVLQFLEKIVNLFRKLFLKLSLMLGQLIQEIEPFLQKFLPSFLSLIIIDAPFRLHIILFFMLIDPHLQDLVPILKGNEQSLPICQQIEINLNFPDKTGIIPIPQVRYLTEDLTILKRTICSAGLQLILKDVLSINDCELKQPMVDLCAKQLWDFREQKATQSFMLQSVRHQFRIFEMLILIQLVIIILICSVDRPFQQSLTYISR